MVNIQFPNKSSTQCFSFTDDPCLNLDFLILSSFLLHYYFLIFIIFYFILLKMGFHHDGQAGLELLTSGGPPTSASQSARITGVSHHARPIVVDLIIMIVFGTMGFVELWLLILHRSSHDLITYMYVLLMPR